MLDSIRNKTQIITREAPILSLYVPISLIEINVINQAMLKFNRYDDIIFLNVLTVDKPQKCVRFKTLSEKCCWFLNDSIYLKKMEFLKIY